MAGSDDELLAKMIDHINQLNAKSDQLENTLQNLVNTFEVLNEWNMGLVMNVLALGFWNCKRLAAAAPNTKDLAPEARAQLAAKVAFRTFADNFPEKARKELEGLRENMIENLIKSAGVEINFN